MMKLIKSELRRQLKQNRLEMPEEEHRLASRDIVERLQQAADWPEVTSLHYFEPLANLAEVDINPFITYLEDAYPDLQLSTSRLIEDKWEVIGVHDGPPPAQFDAIVVPMLGFDPQTLHRIGYGGGYYDRFLAAQPQARKIGICFEQGKVEHIPAEPHDIPVDVVVTDQTVYRTV